MRELGSNAPDYDPDSYGRGSITAPGTTSAAVTYWKMHRPSTAYAVWRSIVPWNRLDSPGHIHEVLAGSYYYPQQESVPEQTWSSAGLLDSMVQGLLGIKIDGTSNSLLFAPHVPSEWDHLYLRNVRLPRSKLSLKIHHSLSEDDLEIQNEGKAVELSYEPEIPLGSRIVDATFNDHAVAAMIHAFAEDQHAKVKLHVPPGTSRLRLRLEGGVSLILDHPNPLVGDPSSTLKLISAVWEGDTLSIEADVLSTSTDTIRIRSAWRLADLKGATFVESSTNEQTMSARESVLSIPRSAPHLDGPHWTRTTYQAAIRYSERDPPHSVNGWHKGAGR